MFKIRAMEPNMVVEMLKSIKEKKAIVTTLTEGMMVPLPSIEQELKFALLWRN